MVKRIPKVLTLEQVLDVLKKVDFEHALLVGGQAVLLYAKVYNIGNSIQLGVSGDIDLIAKAQAAQNLAAQFKNSTLTLAKMDDHTINTAVIAVDLNDEEFFQIDCLQEVSGLDTAKISQRFEEIDFGAGHTFRVINPLDLLTSKLHNIAYIAHKRDQQGFEQAQLALEIAKRYLLSILDESEAVCMKAIEAHFKSCLSPAYVIAHVEHNLDAFLIIEELGITHSEFVEKRLIQMKTEYTNRLQKHKLLLKRRKTIKNKKITK